MNNSKIDDLLEVLFGIILGILVVLLSIMFWYGIGTMMGIECTTRGVLGFIIGKKIIVTQLKLDY